MVKEQKCLKIKKDGDHGRIMLAWNGRICPCCLHWLVFTSQSSLLKHRNPEERRISVQREKEKQSHKRVSWLPCWCISTHHHPNQKRKRKIHCMWPVVVLKLMYMIMKHLNCSTLKCSHYIKLQTDKIYHYPCCVRAGVLLLISYSQFKAKISIWVAPATHWSILLMNHSVGLHCKNVRNVLHTFTLRRTSLCGATCFPPISKHLQ